MDHTPVFNVRDDECHFQKTSSYSYEDKSSVICLRKPLWKGFCFGLLVGCFVTFMGCLAVGLIVFDGFKHQGCKENSSRNGSVDSMFNKLQHLTTHTSTIRARQTSTPVTRTYYNRLTTTVTTPKPHMFHQCQISGGCTSLVYGMECMLDSAGRTSIKYSPLTKKDSIPTFDHCPVSYCTGMNKWSLFSVSLAATECYTNGPHGDAYSGKNTCTWSGRTCQRWDRDYPHKRNRKLIPRNSADLHSNYCRDPGPPYEYKPWCYTTDPKNRWEYCHVLQC